MARPVIGICAALERARWTVWDQQAALVSSLYIEAVQRAGGLAVLLPPDPESARDPDELLDLLDGLILTGGSDLDPALYGQDRDEHTTGVVPERDAFEIALARRAMERDLPFLGICRGMQVMNVAAGGTLHQHLPMSTATRGTGRRSGRSTAPTTTSASRPARPPPTPRGRPSTSPSSITTRASTGSATGSW